MGRQTHQDCSEDVVFITAWQDLEALYAWIGSNDLLWTPLYREGDASLFSRFDIQHFETLAEADAEDIQGMALGAT